MVVEEIKLGNTKVYFHDDYILKDDQTVACLLTNISEIICNNN